MQHLVCVPSRQLFNTTTNRAGERRSHFA